MKRALILLLLLIVAAGCGPAEPAVSEADSVPAQDRLQRGMGAMGMGNGMGDAMRTAHHATIPDAYAAAASPIAADDSDALARGAATYTTYCAVCHGDGGMGDGPGAAALDPAPASIAQSSQMLGDNYLYWRVSEGGLGDPLTSAMPAWKNTLDEAERWEVIAYVQALGAGSVTPRMQMGGALYDPAVEQQKHADMLAEGIDSGVIDADEAALFDSVHAALDAMMAGEQPTVPGNMEANMVAMLAMLVEAGTISSEQSTAFQAIHARLLDAGLMR